MATVLGYKKTYLGAMVTMRVAGRKTPGRPLFVCTSLDEIEFIRSDGVDGDRNATC